MSSRPSPLISYAQNGEDVVLARALTPWSKKGFWVDCGAGHPKYDSVTKLFSQFGWTGINIEPLDEEFMLLTQDRPLDENIQCLLGTQEGVGAIYAGPPENRGSSTSDPLLADRYATEFGQTFQKFEVPVRRLDAILREKARPTIDFLKIDVEGAEEAVLRGIDLQEFHPRILIIEATQPNSTVLSHEAWEPLVLDSGYLFAFFDGLNRYYVNQNDQDILGPLAIPANILDDYKTFVQFKREKHSNQLNAMIGEKDIYAKSLEAMIGEKDIYAKSLEAIIEEKNIYAKSLQTIIEEKDIYAKSLQTTIEEKDIYAKSLQTTIEEKKLLLADQQQKINEVADRFIILQKANESLEKQLIKLHDVERQLATIRSYKLFIILAMTKRILRKATGRK